MFEVGSWLSTLVEEHMKYAVLFPGQGSQDVGMCADVRAARVDLLGPSATLVLGWDLDRLITQGPPEELLRTEHAQPALYSTAFALWSVFSEMVEQAPSAGAGHSLGEYTALAAAGAFSYLDGLALVAKRGKAMARAAGESASGMAALLGADFDTADSIARHRRADGGSLYVANINAPGQVVVAGSLTDLDWLTQNARSLGIRRAVRLKVAAGFHSPFMASAASSLQAALDDVEMTDPQFDVYANVSGRPTTNARETLREQLTAPVKFSQTIENMVDAGIDTFVHLGPGDVTAGLAKRTAKDANVHVVSTIDQARAVADALSVE